MGEKCEKSDREHWLECAKLVTERIATRKDVEWQLAVEHFGALAGCVYAAGVYLTPYLKTADPCFINMGILALAISFVTSIWWAWLIESAHAADAFSFKAYMDTANGINSEEAIELKKRTSAPIDDKKPVPKLAPKWSPQQKHWLGVHIVFSIMVHLVVILILFGLRDDGIRTDIAEEMRNKAKIERAKELTIKSDSSPQKKAAKQ